MGEGERGEKKRGGKGETERWLGGREKGERGGMGPSARVVQGVKVRERESGREEDGASLQQPIRLRRSLFTHTYARQHASEQTPDALFAPLLLLFLLGHY